MQSVSIPVSIYVKIIKIHQDFPDLCYDHKCTATFFLNHTVYTVSVYQECRVNERMLRDELIMSALMLSVSVCVVQHGHCAT